MSDEMPSVVEYSVDLNEQEAPEPLPPGSYVGTIRGVEVKMSQRDTKYAAVTFMITPEQYPADFTEGNPDGTSIIYRRVSLEDNPQARFTTRRFCEAIGAPLGRSIDVSEWIGLEAAVEVQNETYEDIPRPVITQVRAL